VIRGRPLVGLLASLALAAFLGPAPAGAMPAPASLPSGELVAGSEDARYSVAPDGAITARAGLLSFFPEGAPALWPEIQAPASVGRGGLATVLVAVSARLDELEARVSSSSGDEVSRARGFELPVASLERGAAVVGLEPEPSASAVSSAPTAEDEQVRVYALLVGVPSEAPAGSCELRIQGREGARRFVSVSGLEVLPTQFPETRVALSSELTALRTRTDARAREDQKRLERAVSTFTPSAVFHLDAVLPPLLLSPLSAGFGDRRVYLYSNGTTARTTHRGLDVAVPAGTRVGACARGAVILAANLVSTGNTVVVEHLPGLMSFYFHLSRVLVQEGALVEPGDAVGLVGATGLATGAHLHWELRCAGVAIDPRQALDHALVDKAAIPSIIAAYRIQQKRR
jgi:murein DD-endopeptidase MepM/ murein hydrolase activator NlpD